MTSRTLIRTPIPSPVRCARRACALLPLVLAACDAGAFMPHWESEWVLPATSVSVEVESMLPDRVSLSDDARAFVISGGDTTFVRTLADICGSVCGSLQGLFAPKPEFSQVVNTTVPFPAELVGAEIEGGAIVLALTNGFGFDPIRPAAGAFGSITLEIRSAGRVLAATTIDGRATAFGQGVTITRTLDFAPGPVSGSLDVVLNVVSPAGDRVRIDTKQQIEAAVQPRNLRMTELRLALPPQDIPTQNVDFVSGDLDPALLDRVRGGSIDVHVDNPLPVTGAMAVVVSSVNGPLERSVTFTGPGASVMSAAFDRTEIRSILDLPNVSMVMSGSVRGAQDTVSIKPFRSLRFRAELVLRVTNR